MATTTKPKYTTYLAITFNSEGAAPTTVNEKLKTLGWKPVYGDFDYKYEWDDTTWGTKGDNINEFVEFMNTVHNTLKGLNVNYLVKTYKKGIKEVGAFEKY